MDKRIKSQRTRYNYQYIVVLFAISVLLKLWLFTGFTCRQKNAWIYFDSDQYHTIAQSIVQGNGICLQESIPQYYRLPGYSMWWALLLKIMHNNAVNALLLQIVVMSFIPLLLYYVTLHWFYDERLAGCVGLLCAIHPGLTLYSGMIATEPLFILVFLLFLMFFIRSILSTRLMIPNIVLAGFFLGIASLIRPVGHYCLVLASILLCMLLQAGFVKKCGSVCLLWVAWIMPVCPWLIRNYMLAGSLFFHSLPGLHFLQYTGANIIMQRDSCSYLQARTSILNEWADIIQSKEHETDTKLNDYQRCVLGEKLARSYVIAYPWYALKYSCIQLIKTCCALYSTHIVLSDTGVWPDQEKESFTSKIMRFLFPPLIHSWLALFIYAELLFVMIMLIGFLCGLHALCYQSRQHNKIIAVIALFSGLFIGLTIAYGCARLRLPAELFVMLLAAHGLVFMHQFLTSKEPYAGC